MGAVDHETEELRIQIHLYSLRPSIEERLRRLTSPQEIQTSLKQRKEFIRKLQRDLLEYGNSFYVIGDFLTAIAWYQEGIDVNAGLRDQFGRDIYDLECSINTRLLIRIADCLNNIGHILVEVNEEFFAFRHFLEANELYTSALEINPNDVKTAASHAEFCLQMVELYNDISEPRNVFLDKFHEIRSSHPKIKDNRDIAKLLTKLGILADEEKQPEYIANHTDTAKTQGERKRKKKHKRKKKSALAGNTKGHDRSIPCDQVTVTQGVQHIYNPDELKEALKESEDAWIKQKASESEVVRRLKENCSQLNLEFSQETPGDGNCFFHAVGDQIAILGLQSRGTAANLRESVVTFMRSHPVLQGPDGQIDLRNFVTGDTGWEAYCNKMTKDGEWAEHITAIATAYFLQRSIMIVMSSRNSHGNSSVTEIEVQRNEGPIRLGHISELHYQSLKKKAMCTLCHQNFENEKALHVHIHSVQHRYKLYEDDNDCQWSYRKPPMSMPDFQLCESVESGNGVCKFASIDPENNSCTKAHSKEELAEWKQRDRQRSHKMNLATDNELVSFMDLLLLKQEQNIFSQPNHTVAESLPGVDVNIELRQHEDVKDISRKHTWDVGVQTSTEFPLKRVGLLYNSRDFFVESADTSNENLRLQGLSEFEVIQDPEQNKTNFKFKVKFESGAYGAFVPLLNQILLLDFGSEHLLFRKLEVPKSTDQIEEGSELPQGVWDYSNTTIIRYHQDAKVILPTRKHSVTNMDPVDDVDDDLDMRHLSKANYKRLMHRMLLLEEYRRTELVKRYSIKTKMKIDRSQCEGVIHLTTQSSFDDSEAYGIISSSDVTSILVKFNSNATNAYEAKKSSATNDKGEKSISVKLSECCVAEEFKAVKEVKFDRDVEVQFEFNGQRFHSLHDVVERIDETQMSFLFPPRNINPSLTYPVGSVTESDVVDHLKVNKWQDAAVRYIERRGGEDETPILLIHGPFGTGKTHTLLLAIQQVLSRKDTTPKILVCTHSDSAADVYINKLDPFVKGKKGVKMRRFFPLGRNLDGVSRTFKQYVVYKVKDVEDSQMIVTTNMTANRLASKMKGKFTHIIVDEAGQALEPETIIPLTLAASKTCVVLAGDHMQISPKVYSESARLLKFDSSLLQRVFEHCIMKKCEREILLRYNYRSRPEILAFVSKMFYQGIEIHEGQPGQPRHPLHYPIEFRSTSGTDQAYGDSYINLTEVQVVADQVEDLVNNWPRRWPEEHRRQDQIGVLCHFSEQVVRIKKELRKRKLGSVVVKHVRNVQGKEFRAVFISTVRTRATMKQAMQSVTTSLTNYQNECVKFECGFFTDPKLLNTALTRAMSYVVVVGDPVALCSIGDCQLVWKNYIRKCEKESSLFPREYTFKDIENDALSTVRELRPLCLAKSSEVPCNATMQQGSDESVQHQYHGPRQRFSRSISLPLGTSYNDMDDESDSSSDDIRRDLVLQRYEEPEDFVESDSSSGSDESSTTTDDDTLSDVFREPEAISTCHTTGGKDGSAVSSEQPTSFHDREKRSKIPVPKPEYRICKFFVDAEGRWKAKTIPESTNDEGEEIYIQRCHRGCAMDGDTIRVELVQNKVEEEDAKVFDLSSLPKRSGKVLDVLKPVERTGKEIVCKLDSKVDNLMIPIDPRWPTMYISGKSSNVRKRDENEPVSVTVYRHDGGYGHEEIISNKERRNKLFVVQWCGWKKRNARSGKGKVVLVLPEGNTEEAGINVLKRIYEIGEDEPSGRDAEHLDTKLAEEVLRRRNRKVDHLVFTVDSEDAQDLDDALSIAERSDGLFSVGVHIADVSFFVRHGTMVDKEAYRRATTAYPASHRVTHMLPANVRRVCSLHPLEDRLALSVFFAITKEGIIKSSRFERTVVQSHEKLTYDEANQRLKKDDTSAGVDKSLQLLKDVITGLRKIRGITRNVAAKDIVEEMMHLTGITVANYLLQKHLQSTALKVLLEMSNLKKPKDIKAAKAEKNRLLIQKYAANVRDIITDAEGFIPPDEKGRDFPLYILRNKWDQMFDIITKYSEKLREEETKIFLAQIIHDEETYTLKATELHSPKSSGEYACSRKDISRCLHSHFKTFPENFDGTELQPVYTLFTSPIRRYFDIVTHRQLCASASLQEVDPHLYDREQIERICHHCTVVTTMTSTYEQRVKGLQLALEIQKNPLPSTAVVTKIDETALRLGFGHEKRLREALETIDIEFNVLKPIRKPDVPQSQTGTKITLSWKERIYNHKETETMTSNNVWLRSDYALRLSYVEWQNLITTLHTCEIDDVRKAMKDVNREYVNRKCTTNEVTCETPDDKPPKHYIEFKRMFEFGDVVEVQLYAEMVLGLIAPRLQLFNITRKVQFCAEHRLNAVRCFSEGASRKPHRGSSEVYTETWLPILQVAAAYNAVYNNDTCVLQDVKIDWIWKWQADGQHTGSFTLPYTFCQDRNLGLSQTTEKHHIPYYLCIRYSSINIPVRYMKAQDAIVHETKKPKPKEERNMTMVIHAKVSDINEEKKTDGKNESLTVCFRVAQCSASFTRNIRRHLEDQSCSVEVIPQTNPDRRLDEAIRGIRVSSELVRNICLNVDDSSWYADPSLTRQYINQLQDLDVPGLPLPNSSQKEGIARTLAQSFTAIQGPPGTGKTVTGARIVHQFVLRNRQRPDTGRGCPKVLYCGPSNKSVDVVAGYLKCFPKVIKPLRVYGEHIEEKDFPTSLLKPTGKMSSREIRTDERHRDIALHHLIRDNSYCPNGERIKHQYSGIRRFINRGEDPPRKIVAGYKEMVRKAKQYVLHRSNVILCTCSVAGSPHIQNKEMTNIIQAIVDEAGMCTEPETLIPLVSTNPKTVVLIGDHKQLRPIIQEPTAVQLDMDISLFERYEGSSLMLNIQYRMHPGICEFPSKEFYENKLNTDESVNNRPEPTYQINWPGGRKHPFVFRHIVGEETVQTVHDDDGNEFTKANEKEAQEAVMTVKKLIQKGVDPKDIVILSQYRLQCTIINRRLKDSNVSGVDVRTVVLSQGSEWEYVILSTVRSLPWREIEETPTQGWLKKHLGFIADQNQMNVALTRAKRGLIIIGNRYLLSKHDHWRALIDYYENRNCVKTDEWL